MRPWIKKWYVQKCDHGCRQGGVANATPLPVKGQEYDREQFHRYRQPKSDGRSRPPSML